MFFIAQLLSLTLITHLAAEQHQNQLVTSSGSVSAEEAGSTRLRCFHCSNPSREIAPGLWIHKPGSCRKRKPMTCSIRAVACVFVEVTHPLLGFSATGCSEDSFVGCDSHLVPDLANATMHRCQCSSSYCNREMTLSSYLKNASNVSDVQYHVMHFPSPQTHNHRQHEPRRSHGVDSQLRASVSSSPPPVRVDPSSSDLLASSSASQSPLTVLGTALLFSVIYHGQ